MWLLRRSLTAAGEIIARIKKLNIPEESQRRHIEVVITPLPHQR